MSTRRDIRFIIVLLTFLIHGATQLWAVVDNDIHIQCIGEDPNASAPTMTASVGALDAGKYKVTLTATFDDTKYTINKNGIIVLPAKDPSNSPQLRRVGIAGALEVTKVSDTEYYFMLPNSYDGAIVTAYYANLNPIEITDLSDITNPLGNYKVGGTSVSGTPSNNIGAETNPFMGTLDGNYAQFSLSAPLFDYVQDAVVKNVIVQGNISGSGNVGAIAGNALGASRIYNCGVLATAVYDTDGNLTGFSGSSVGGSGNVGGIVGTLSGTSRVINCFSYATITSGLNVGGIVGYNSVASSQANVATMVMNCMFYGDIIGGSTVSPVYGGENINNVNMVEAVNKGLATYNYYAYSQLKTTNISADKYNCALAMEERFLNRCEIYRQLLNSNKKLAAIYATGSADNADQMAKWVLETADRQISDPMPYPVLRKREQNKKYPSIINYDATNAPDSASVGRNHGGKLGKTLSVTISNTKTNGGQTWPSGASITTSSLTLQRTDKDFDRFNFNYDKVQLPYYNDVGTGNYTGNRVVTGWKIVSVSGGTAGTFSKTDAWGGYNFADRNCTDKDVYGVSGRVFSQGAYYDVPYGVTGITIEPYWGVAAYVSDPYYDVVYSEVSDQKNNYTTQNVNVSASGLGTQNTNNTNITINGSSQKVYTSINNARASMTFNDGETVYDHAVVLVGNVHRAGTLYGSGANDSKTPYTIMSVDLDKDNEPDYSLIFSHYNRQGVTPIRFDFINIPGTAQAQKPNGATQLLNVSIFNPKGWFELTNTCNVFITQFEADNGLKDPAPVILLGGVIDQYTSTQQTEIEKDVYNNKTQYIHLGSNVCFKDFGNGTHSDGWYATRHVPVSVTGGDFDGFYLSGVYRPDAQIMDDDAEGYISGGRFKEIAGAAQQMINGNVRFQIYDADITNFYGGGINAEKPITGNVTVDIINSHVDTYCGGPKFGDMQKAGTTFETKYSNDKAGSSNKLGTKTIEITTDGIVTTNATGCTFGKFFGAGYGGASSYKLKYYDNTTYDFTTATGFTTLIGYYNNDRGKYYDGNTSTYKTSYGNKGPGVATDFDYEFFVWSSGKVGARFYVNYTTFSLAKTNNVNSYLTKCTVNENFYGGGSLGVVDGSATSKLEDCTIHGSVYGAGFSASIPSVPIRTKGFAAIPFFNVNSGIFELGKKNGTTNFQWKEGTLPANNNTALDGDQILTDVELDHLGTVTGKVTLNIEGTTTVAGNVYGGGESSDATNDVMVNVKGGTMTDVFGGGKGQTTVVGGDVTVNIGTLKEGSTTEYEGTAEISGSVYGGSALGAVNAAKQTNSISYVDGKNTFVNLNKGTVNGAVYGGGLGAAAVGTEGEQGYVAPISANVYGPVTVTTKGGTAAKVFGCNNLMGAPQQTVSVNIDGGNITSAYGGGNLAGYSGTPTVVMTGGNVGNVYGGGYGASASVAGTSVTMKNGTGEGNTGGTAGYIFGGGEEAPVTGSVVVNIQGGTVSHDVYGGGALAHTNTANWNATAGAWADETATSTANTTTVRLTGGTIVGDAYGGGLGDTDTPAYVYGDVLVDLNGETTYDTDGKIQTNPVIAKGCIVNRVFGCNNVNGTPKGEVLVHVHATQSGVDGKETVGAKAEKNTNTYDVEAVYGGGNQAEYYPVRADATDATEANHVHTNVIVDGCALTSIKQVYGGGNAASSPATSVTIYGAYEIDEVFGGGNGKDDIAPGVANPGAHVGFHKYDSDTDKANQQYGFGKAQVNIGGGTIHSVFGGSNSKGNVRDIAVATLDELSDCDFRVGEAYGGGKEAEMDGRAVLRLGCIPAGGLVGDIYGGAKMTNVNNDVELTITNGTFTRVYGGNNLSGKIKGTITVNVVESGCTPIIIDQLFGGGNQAAYSVEDIPEANRVTDATADNYYKNFPKVNIISATRIGQVYGGGDNAMVTGNPHVKIDMEQGVLNKGKSNEATQALGKIGQVFGGGNNADVTGNTHVEIVKGQITYDQVVKTAATATIPAEYYLPGVYGGCNTQGTITGDTHVTIKGGTIGVGTLDLTTTPKVMTRTKKGNVHGGGYGKDTYVAGSVTMNIGESTTSGDAVIFGDVYGGGALGHVNAQKTGETMTFTTGTTTVNLNKGVIYGDAYGGGLGLKKDIDGAAADQPAHVGGDIQVNQNGVAFIIDYVNTTDKDPDDDTKYIKVVNSGRIFGSNNLCGSPQGNITVTVNKTVEGNVAKTATDDIKNADATHSYELAAVYGGGNLAPYSTEGKKTNVIIKGCGETSIETVYGGGNAAPVPETDVDVYGTYEIGYVFGGGNGKDKYQTDAGWIANPGANVNGNANTMLYGGVVHEAYGGSNEQGTITGDVAIDMSATNPEETCELDVDKLVGAGKNADVNGNLMMVMGCKPNKFIPLVYGGADNANVNGNVELTITSGRFGQVFGGNNLGGAIKGHIILNIEETGECGTPITIDELYLGGNEAAYSVYGYNDDGSCKTSGDEIYDNPILNLISCTRIGKVFGGGLGTGAAMYANPTVNINMIPGSQATAYNLGTIGDVYGGGNQAEIHGKATVNIGTASKVTVKSMTHNTDGTYTAGTAYVQGARIVGNVFGGGNKATVKTTEVNIGTLVYSADDLADIAAANLDKTKFEGVSIESVAGEETTTGIVFGGGNDADVTGNTVVNMAGGYVRNRIYGGGNLGNVGTFTTTTSVEGHTAHDDCIGKPNSFAENTGLCTVVISGGQVGPTGMTMPMDFGYVFGAGRGDMKDPEEDEDIDFRAYVNSTNVTISGSAFILGGVYGGSENGRVFTGTDVKIEGGQIGAGEGMTRAYTSQEWASNDPAILKECASWEFESPYLPYDEHATTNTADARPTGSDGHTFYGNVFGGGSGYWSYKKKDNSGYEWLPSAGLVEGDTHVTISGGHILTSVYGGNELTNVTGTCNVTMTGGTIGVPRTLDQIDKHPVTCNLFGAGKGDQRSHFKEMTNVGNVVVNVSGGTIYGSVFGGGEDGHVTGNVMMNISEDDATKPTIIGTLGTSYMEGNVFGAGRGFSGETVEAGLVGGNISINISGGKMLGSVYGGGRLGSVNGDVTMDISGGTIGNNSEYKYYSFNVDTENKTLKQIDDAAKVKLQELKNVDHIPYTDFERYDSVKVDANTFNFIYRVKHTKGGNVFAGGMGRLYALDGTTPLEKWYDLGKVKSTKLNITGGTIKSNVYGGGELGKVTGYRTTTDSQNASIYASTDITINQNENSVIGTDVSDGTDVKYTFGSVFGGGFGSTVETFVSESDEQSGQSESDVPRPKTHAGLVMYSTMVAMQSGKVLASIYGGGEVASVEGGSDVAVSGGTIGKDKITSGNNTTYFGGISMGNVYGGGKGDKNIVRSGNIKKNTRVTVSGSPTIYHNIYGGGAYGSVGTFNYTKEYDSEFKTWKVTGIESCESGTGTAIVTIKSGTIGVDGMENGMVFGSSRGDVGVPGSRDDRLAWVDKTQVEIGESGTVGPTIVGSVYGSGENGHTLNDCLVEINSGTVGIEEGVPLTSGGQEYSGANYPYRGNVYGSGCGTDTYTAAIMNDQNQIVRYVERYNPLAGVALGNTTVNIKGGHVVRNVYGGGAMGSVGTITSKEQHANIQIVNDKEVIYGFGLSWPYKLVYKDNTGQAVVNVTGGVIGVSGTTGGDVYGAARGEAGDRYEMAEFGNVYNTKVTINDATIYGSVYGGAENGHVIENTDVKIESGARVKHSVFGGGKGMGKYPVTLKVYGGGTRTDNIYSMTAGKVYGNTYVTMTGGEVGYNVYGGGDMGSVGKGNYAGGADDYSKEGYGETLTGNLWENNEFLNSGKTNVKITGGTIGTGTDATNTIMPTGNVFGGCRGEASPNVDPTLAPRYHYFPVYYVGYINESNVEIDGGSILGSVYGGGQDGHVRRSTKVTVNDGVIGKAYDANDSQKENRGNVYGSGSGLGVYKYDVEQVEHEAHSTASGSVTCNTVVNIKGGTIYQNVYGGGALSSVGAPKIEQVADATKAQTLCQVNIEGGDIGTAAGFTNHQYGGLVFGAGRGGGLLTGEDPADYATSIWTEVNVKGGTVHGSVFGGGEQGLVKQSVEVNITGGTVEHDVYGGGALANTNTSNSEGKTDECTTAVNLTGGTIGSAYGGALGQKTGINGATSDVAAYVNGDVTVTLNGSVVTGSVFGCNNINGTPKGHTLVYVKQTKPRDGHTYDVDAVYGGGSRADYDPIDAKKYAEVIIEGCDQTSIEEVYGGGYGAATPGTLVLIKGTKIIDNVFGGGYGASTETFSNPGANVGYHTDGSPYSNSNKAVVQLMAGKVNNVYGGSNSKGDIRNGSSVTNVTNTHDSGCCANLEVQHIYGGGKNAEMQGGTEIVLGCMPNDWIAEIYAGAENADVGNDVSLTITSGKFGRVFGGNKSGGRLNGGIDVKIEESGKCGTPIVIGELYGGGNEAPYSVYGYKDEKDSNGKWIPRQLSDFEAMTPEQRQAESMESGPNHAPRVHVRAFTSIGNIFGGGYGADAVMVGSPEVNINEVMVVDEDGNPSSVAYDVANDSNVPAFIDGVNVKLYPHEAKKMGVIGNVFGGGNAAKVIGDTYVNVAIDPSVDVHVMDAKGDPVINSEGVHTFQSRPVLGADIRGNVYGGGNNAEVTGKTNVQIGR